jgi:type I restriction enzyme S subunit
MELRRGYKQTEVGVIPEDWDTVSLSALLRQGPTNGWSGPSTNDTTGTPTLSLAATTSGRLVLNAETVKYLEDRIPRRSDLYLALGDILVQRSNTVELVGTTAVFDGPPGVFVYPDLMMRLRFKQPATGRWFWRYANSASGRFYFRSIAAGSTGSMPKISGAKLREMPVPLPALGEQEAIAEALSDADALIGSLEQLLAKKRQVKQGAMQELLTGKKRLPSFSGEWEMRRIADIASPSSEKNSSGEPLTVLTCSKHLGFVDSLRYFKNQVFSRDTSGYKVIKRGQIGYPSNHVEEGSIGLQDLYDVALVSPIYVVFSVTDEVDSYFLHRLLKLDSYRQKFVSATSSSVDRRGSLRWPVFSEITVNLPPVEEQTAIVEILRDMDAEAAALEAKLTKAQSIKQGMMQELLTGRIRLV